MITPLRYHMTTITGIPWNMAMAPGQVWICDCCKGHLHVASHAPVHDLLVPNPNVSSDGEETDSIEPS